MILLTLNSSVKMSTNYSGTFPFKVSTIRWLRYNMKYHQYISANRCQVIVINFLKLRTSECRSIKRVLSILLTFFRDLTIPLEVKSADCDFQTSTIKVEI